MIRPIRNYRRWLTRLCVFFIRSW